jgi:hypothetical protein
VNPARSFGPAVFVGGPAIQQLWVFQLFPTLGGAVAGLLFRVGVLEVDEEPKLELETLPPQLPAAKETPSNSTR